jgi:hypothetical protein
MTTTAPFPTHDDARPISDIVPELIGLSVGRLDGTLPCTWSATDELVAVLDACQYVSGGPCVSAALDGRPVEARPGDPEGGWPLFTRAAGAAGVGATMSLPVSDPSAGVVVGTVNLYAASADAFAGRREELQAWAAQWGPATAITRAETSHTTRRAPAAERQRDVSSIDRAVAIISHELHTDVAAAADLLTSAARRAGLSDSAYAQALTQYLGSD